MVQLICLMLGRCLLGAYFLLPGIHKIVEFEKMTQYMAAFNLPFISVLLYLTIVIQIVAGGAIMVGFKTKPVAMLLACLTLVISVVMHSFWNLPEGFNAQHEAQNFVKNMAIMAGLLILAAHGAGPASLDNTLNKKRRLG